MKKLIFLIVLSLAIATGLFFINSSVIVNSWDDKVYEIVLMAIPVFIILALLFFANRAVVKTVKGIKNKKPSGKEGL